MMRHGSLFSGIGGFDLAASWLGWENLFHCERDTFCRKVLEHHFPQSESYGDIHGFDATKYRGTVDVISGGFPRQPFSVAGKRKGKDDDRYLFPQALRIVRESRPRWVVLENVAGLFTILEPESLSEMEIKEVGLFCSDDGKQEANATVQRIQRRVIGAIVTEIQSAGYSFPRLNDGTPVVLCIPACGVGAPHRRDRVWFVAHADDETDRPGEGTAGKKGGPSPHDVRRDKIPGIHQGRAGAAFGRGKGHTGCAKANGGNPGIPVGTPPGDDAGRITGKGTVPGWDKWPLQPLVRRGDDGFSLALDGISFPKWRDATVKAYGNAIVPQVALEIFRAIAAVEGMAAAA